MRRAPSRLRPRRLSAPRSPPNLADCTRRKLAPASLVVYRKLLEDHLTRYLGAAKDIAAITPLDIERFQGAKKGKRRKGSADDPPGARAATTRKDLANLRAFFNYCVRHRWITENPARMVRPPLEDAIPTQPYTEREVQALLEGAITMHNNNPIGLERARLRAYGLQMILLYSGLRIGDVARLLRTRIDRDGYLFVRAEKNKVPVRIMLPPECLAALDAIPHDSEYFFHSGAAEFATTERELRRTLSRVGRRVKVHCHPHRYRDTFAKCVLDGGADLRTLQILLGHRSIKTTEKHYAMFQVSQQKLLDSATAALQFGHKPSRPLLVVGG